MRGGFGALAYGIAWLGGTAPSQATQAQLEAETAGALYVPPNLVRNSPGVAKAWCRIAAAGTLESPSYNIASITDVGVGARTVVIATDFSGSIWMATGSIAEVTSSGFIQFSAMGVGSIDLDCRTHLAVQQDQVNTFVAFGDQ